MLRFLLYSFVLLTLASCGSNKAVNSVFSDYKKSHDMMGVSVPGWVVNKVKKIAMKSSDNPEFAEYKDVFGDAKKLRLLVGKKKTGDNNISNKHLTRLRNSNYEPLLIIKTEDAKVQFWAKEKDNVVQDIFIWIDAEEDIFLLQFKGKIDLNKLPKSLLKKAKPKNDKDNIHLRA